MFRTMRVVTIYLCKFSITPVLADIPQPILIVQNLAELKPVCGMDQTDFNR